MKNLIIKLISNPLSLLLMPVLGTFIAVNMDIGALRYYGIPSEYAEVNVKTILNSTLRLILYVSALAPVAYVIYYFSDKYKTFKYLITDPFLTVFPIIFFGFGKILELSILIPITMFFMGILVIVQGMYFTENGYRRFSDKLHWSLNRLRNRNKHRFATSLLHRCLYVLVGILLGLMALILTERWGYDSVSKDKLLIVLDMPNTIAVKRNEDVYILKQYEPKTSILHDGFKVLKLSDKPLNLQEYKFAKKLSTKNEAKPGDVRKRIIRNFKSFVKNSMSFASFE